MRRKHCLGLSEKCQRSNKGCGGCYVGLISELLSANGGRTSSVHTTWPDHGGDRERSYPVHPHRIGLSSPLSIYACALLGPDPACHWSRRLHSSLVILMLAMRNLHLFLVLSLSMGRSSLISMEASH